MLSLSAVSPPLEFPNLELAFDLSAGNFLLLGKPRVLRTELLLAPVDAGLEVVLLGLYLGLAPLLRAAAFKGREKGGERIFVWWRLGVPAGRKPSGLCDGVGSCAELGQPFRRYSLCGSSTSEP